MHRENCFCKKKFKKIQWTWKNISSMLTNHHIYDRCSLTWSRFLKNCIVILSSIWYSWIRAVKRWRTLISSLMIWSFCPLVLPFKDSNSAVLRWRSISSWALCYRNTKITWLSRICLKITNSCILLYLLIHDIQSSFPIEWKKNKVILVCLEKPDLKLFIFCHLRPCLPYREA